MKSCLEHIKKISFGVFLIGLALGTFSLVFAESKRVNCEDFSQLESFCKTASKEECKSVLEKCEQYFQARITETEAEIEKSQYKKKTLAQEIKRLNAQIRQLEALAKQLEISIYHTKINIQTTEGEIRKKETEIQETKKKIKEILKTIYRLSNISSVELLFSAPTITEFYDDKIIFESLQMRVKYSLDKLKGLKMSFEEYKKQLEKEEEDLQRQLKLQLLQKEETEKVQKEKQEYLKMTEREYAQKLKEKEDLEALAREIRKRIFQLVGVPRSPTFGEAYQVAKWVSSITGVRPAFLLAILQQESAIGKNVGQCYLKDVNTGSGVRISTGESVDRVMHPTRDVPLFLQITKSLGRDPFSTPVSCPLSFGWGGAMGPAQFIPSTWNLYKDRLANILGRQPDPWEIKDSFLAAGLYLADLGGTTPTGERGAALGYFGGDYSWYANSVLAWAQKFEEDIKVLEQAGKNVLLRQKLFSLISPPLFRLFL